ncbi:MAG: Holliday junction branch migration DNA helicase RuvB [candidate division Zixibacteria bacterium]|nr:Holliday junction branch migration DNA helicase RuvB [candidate division Zixibacteria bacterium]
MTDLSRSELISREEKPEDATFTAPLRPRRFDEFVGQKAVLDNLKIAVAAARDRGEPLDHLLLYSPPGLGKTTLAHVVANELAVSITATSGPALERPGDLMGLLTNLGEGDILFIDEVHRLPRVVEEFLYPALEEFKIDFILDKGPEARTVKFNLKPFTLVGATTRVGLLTAPLRDRFGLFHHLEFYPPADLERILLRSAKILAVPLTRGGAEAVARRARGTPRVANRLLRRVRDYAQVKGRDEVDEEAAAEALKLLGIDREGLDALDRRVLNVIIDTYDGGPVGLKALAATLNEEEDTLADVVEPFLLKIGFLGRTQRGRVATRRAYEHQGKKAPRDLPEIEPLPFEEGGGHNAP